MADLSHVKIKHAKNLKFDASTNTITDLGNNVGTTCIGRWMRANEDTQNILTVKMHCNLNGYVPWNQIGNRFLFGLVGQEDVNQQAYFLKNSYIYRGDGYVYVNGANLIKVDFQRVAGVDSILTLTYCPKLHSLRYKIVSANYQKVEKGILLDTIAPNDYKWGISLSNKGFSCSILDISSIPNPPNEDEKKTDAKILSLQSEVDECKQQMGNMKILITDLEEEKKENQMVINELEAEIKRLKLSSLKTNEYTQWSLDEVVHWMISVDPSMYQKYKDVLVQKMSEEEVNGECLEQVDIKDIKRWGIKNFMHSKKLLKAINDLIQSNQNEGLQSSANESTAYL